MLKGSNGHIVHHEATTIGYKSGSPCIDTITRFERSPRHFKALCNLRSITEQVQLGVTTYLGLQTGARSPQLKLGHRLGFVGPKVERPKTRNPRLLFPPTTESWLRRRKGAIPMGGGNADGWRMGIVTEGEGWKKVDGFGTNLSPS